MFSPSVRRSGEKAVEPAWACTSDAAARCGLLSAPIFTSCLSISEDGLLHTMRRALQWSSTLDLVAVRCHELRAAVLSAGRWHSEMRTAISIWLAKYLVLLYWLDWILCTAPAASNHQLRAYPAPCISMKTPIRSAHAESGHLGARRKSDTTSKECRPHPR